MAEELVWRQRQDRHYRRYSNPAKFPYLVRWGNTSLTSPAKMRTRAGARLVALAWQIAGRKGIFIVKRVERG